MPSCCRRLNSDSEPRWKVQPPWHSASSLAIHPRASPIRSSRKQARPTERGWTQEEDVSGSQPPGFVALAKHMAPAGAADAGGHGRQRWIDRMRPKFHGVRAGEMFDLGPIRPRHRRRPDASNQCRIVLRTWAVSAGWRSPNAAGCPPSPHSGPCNQRTRRRYGRSEERELRSCELAPCCDSTPDSETGALVVVRPSPVPGTASVSLELPLSL
jgi:hypothetical protein